jgi:cation:H+ antiporter
VLRFLIVAAFAACVPALWLVTSKTHIAPSYEAIVFGIAILGAAFILSWAAEVAQMDVSQALATAILALICVLPEYAVDLYSRGAPPRTRSTVTTPPPT